MRAEAVGGYSRIGIYSTTGVNEDLQEDCELGPVEGYPSYLSNFAAFFEGNTFTTGTPYVMSDERLKTNKQKIESASELLSKIKTYTYEYKPNKSIPVSKGLQRGVMAQEVAEHMPNTVIRLNTPAIKDIKTGMTRTSQEIYAVNYLEFIPLLISAFNEKSKEADELEEQVARQSSTIDELLNRLNALEQKLDQICEQGCAGLQQRSSATPSLLNESLKFYPNPGSNRVTIDLNNLDISGEYYVTVYSSNGQMLFSKRLTNTSSLSEQLETGSWSAGAYTVSLSDKSKVISSGTLMITK